MLTNYAIEQMGFRPFGEEEIISAAFHSVRAYEVQGFVISDGSVSSIKSAISGEAYGVAIAASVNQACRVLLNDDYVEDEAAWETENKCTPPYVVVHIGPTSTSSVATGYVRKEESSITTYDCFNDLKAELDSIESKVIPPLISSMACVFGSEDKTIKFKLVSRSFFGTTQEGVTLHDLRFESNMSFYASSNLTGERAQAGLLQSSRLASGMNQKVSRFFNLALREDDILKKFLFFFLSIEVQIHAVFSSINHSSYLTGLIKSPLRIQGTIDEFFDTQRKKWTTLQDRFIWCSLCAWPQLNDSDINEFHRLKTVRDDIAHGSITAPTAESVVAVEQLAAKLHRS